LAPIGVSRGEKVAFANVYIRLFQPVFIHIAEHKAVCAVIIGAPAFVGWLHMLSGLVGLCEQREGYKQKNCA
jgi:hypothetical protein